MEVMVPEPKLDMEGDGGPLDTRVTKHKKGGEKRICRQKDIEELG